MKILGHALGFVVYLGIVAGLLLQPQPKFQLQIFAVLIILYGSVDFCIRVVGQQILAATNTELTTGQSIGSIVSTVVQSIASCAAIIALIWSLVPR